MDRTERVPRRAEGDLREPVELPRLSRRTLLQIASLVVANNVLGCGPDDFRDIPPQGPSRLYPKQSSLLAGDTLTLHVSTDAPQFRIDFYRQGSALELVFQSDWQAGVAAPQGRPDRDFDFPGYDFEVPETVRPGVYVATLVEGEDDSPLDVPASAALKARTLFVVRTPASQAAPILYKLPLATYQAYNFTGGGSLYHVAKDRAGRHRFNLTQASDEQQGCPAGLRVSLRRPGNGTGGDAWHQDLDPYDARSARNTFEHWDAPFIAFLERQGYDVDYCVDLDVHQDAELLTPYRLLVCAGHDEYWSESQRRNTESFMQGGGNVAFFTGNTCWWRVHYVDGDTAMICDKHNQHDQWFKTEPEDSLLGVSYRHAGSWWQSRRVTLGYTVQFADHWVYAGTGLGEGSVFGADPEQPLVGYECDGTPFTRDLAGRAVPSYPPRCGTPAGFTILGVAELSRAWPTRNGQGATMGLFTAPGGGTVFNAATTDWAKLLDRDAAVAQITRNVIETLSTPS